MGVEYFAVCASKGEMFELGRGHWLSSTLARPKELDEFTEEVGQAIGEDERVARKVAFDLWRWCGEHDWEVELVSDAHDKWAEIEIENMRVTGERFYESERSPESIRSLVELIARQIRIDLCVDEVDLTVRVLSEADEESDDLWCTYNADVRVDGVGSSYHRRTGPR